MRELQAVQNKSKIYAPEEFTLLGAFFCLLFYSAPARHEQDTECLRMVHRVVGRQELVSESEAVANSSLGFAVIRRIHYIVLSRPSQ